jgi:hypothetical protein
MKCALGVAMFKQEQYNAIDDKLQKEVASVRRLGGGPIVGLLSTARMDGQPAVHKILALYH